jgi:hypothetical protein
MPRRSLLAPHWTRPALLGPDRAFEVIAASRSIDRPRVILTQGGEAISARVDHATPLRQGLARYTCIAPEAQPGRLYDLELRYQDAFAGMPRAAAVLPKDTTVLALLHCTDLHLLVPVAGQGMVDRSALLSALVARINALRPDLVVCTGDVITRYDTRKGALPADTIREQIRRAVALLALIEVPLYVTLGNHDAAFEVTREDWYAAMGGGWNGGTDEYSLDWGAVHLAMLDCFAHYDPQNVLVRRSFTDAQLDWLRRDLQAAAAARQRLVFAHYDYREQLPALLPELEIDGLFYGHARGLYPEALHENGVRDGHLYDTYAYNLVRVAPEGITFDKVSWEALAARAQGPGFA